MNLRIAYFVFYLIFAAYALNVMTQKNYAGVQATENQSKSSSHSQPDIFLVDLQADVDVPELKPKEALGTTPTSDTPPLVSFKRKDVQLPAKIYQLLKTPPPESVFSV